MIRLRQPEAPDGFTARQPRQILMFLRIGTELKNRQHDQRGLHTHHGTVAGVHPLYFARDEAVAHIVEARAAELFGDGGAQQTQLAHLAEYRGVGQFLTECPQYSRRQLFLRILARRIPHHDFFRRQLRFEQQRIVPMKTRSCHGPALIPTCARASHNRAPLSPT